jgi:hypothetical protein
MMLSRNGRRLYLFGRMMVFVLNTKGSVQVDSNTEGFMASASLNGRPHSVLFALDQPPLLFLLSHDSESISVPGPRLNAPP